MSPGQVAFMNGLRPNAHVITGTALKLPGRLAAHGGARPGAHPARAGRGSAGHARAA